MFRATTAWVRVDAQVSEKNRPVRNLTKNDFAVYDEGQPRRILYFGYDTEPLDVLLLLDVSGSMRRYLEQMAADAGRALAELHEGDRVGVMLFGRNARLREEFTTDRLKVVAELKDAVRDQSLGSGTRINPAILEAAAYMAREHEAKSSPGRRAVLIVTDNMSLNYLAPDEKAIEALLAADTVLNAIVVGRGERPRPARAGEHLNPDFTPSDVFHIAEATGGEAVKADQAGVSLRDMMESVRTRYSIQYSAPESAAAGTFRHIRVELSGATRRRHPNASIRARSGYVVVGR